MKCDRNIPCQNCVKRNLSTSCTYINSSPREKSSLVQKPGHGSKDVQTQIRNIEELLICLMNRTSKPTTKIHHPATSSFSHEPNTHSLDPVLFGQSEQTSGPGLKDAVESFGQITIKDDQPNYVGSAHWAAILENVSCIEDLF
jgi:hypothetical protein